MPQIELGSERMPNYRSLRIEDSPLLASESFNPQIVFFNFDSVGSVKGSVNEKKILISTAIRSFTGFSISPHPFPTISPSILAPHTTAICVCV
jgi:hypothetical protein